MKYKNTSNLNTKQLTKLTSKEEEITMRISFDDRVQAVSNRGLYPRKIVDKFYRLKVVDLFWVLSE